jgi:diguanylate cyclase (GGDEF)-like protein
MKNDQIALYLNDHPEFFNQYPELLARIQAIAPEDMPLKPVKTLNIADRIVKRAQADTANMKSQLVNFMEISQANEKIQENLFEIDRIIMYSLNFSQMIGQLREEIIKRFKIPGVQIILMDGDAHLMERCLKERLDKNSIEGLQFVDTETVSGWFGADLKPVLQAEMKEGAEICGATSDLNIQSEALIPIILHGNLIGAIALGSENPQHFHIGLRTDLLERTADKLGIAIENVLLLDLMKSQPVLDSKTGLYNEIYLDPVLRREFGWAQCYGKSLSLIKMHIDSFEELVNTYGKSRIQKVLQEASKVLAENSRGGDIMISSGDGDFLILLPDTSEKGAGQIAERIRKTLVTHMFPDLENDCVRIIFGVASAIPGKDIDSPADLLAAASDALEKAQENKDKALTV